MFRLDAQLRQVFAGVFALSCLCLPCAAQPDAGYLDLAYLAPLESNGDVKKWDSDVDGPDGLFGDAASWDPDGVPTASDSATFDLAQTYTVDLDVDATNVDANVQYGDVTIRGYGGAHLYTLTGALTVADAAALTLQDISCNAQGGVSVGDSLAGYVGFGEVTVELGGALWTAGGRVGQSTGTEGMVSVSGAASTWTCDGDLNLGVFGEGSLLVSGGAAATCNSTSLGGETGSVGTLDVADAESAFEASGSAYIGGTAHAAGGSGFVSVNGSGRVSVGQTLKIWPGATVDVNEGTLSVDTLDLAGGAFNPNAGSHIQVNTLLGLPDEMTFDGWLTVGHSGGTGVGSHAVNGPQSLEVADGLVVASDGQGTLLQTGGEVSAGAGVHIGKEEGSQGQYAISGGSLVATGMYVGLGGPGTLSINDPSASVEVQAEFVFGPHAIFAAAPGSKIHMTGSVFTNQSTDSSSVSGLENLELVFEGGSALLDPFEVAGQDMGPILAGFADNFTLGTLRVGGDQVGRVQLVDLIVNQLGPPAGAEALYVETLILDNGSYLDLNGLNLYCRTFQDLGGTLEANGGQLIQVQATIPGDANADGAVTDADYTIWADHYGQCDVGVAQGDFNDDGCVTDADYTVWADHYGEGTGAGIPEPATALFVAAGGLVTALRRRR